MQLINVLTIGLLAVAGVSAAPGNGNGNGNGKGKGKGQPACLLSGQVYNGAGKECKCPPGQYKKPNHGKCGYYAFPSPQCGGGEKPYCARSRNEYCGYEEQHDYCEHNGQNSAFCCKEGDLSSYLNSHYDY